ncbi:MoaD/ThiS family protein [Aliarcobacter butzleri]|uniref:MoaD/ThiS family protein n=1 Tax=Aliarcobacter butzleri TaxID=28197 RepID=A0AAW6VMS3_9BACT|nr:MoaD/ThiS family protein [Aliarcobacter butzleri]MDK2061910.1 MoaD/ThiS family protein [Aliarcobacter butzleri]
MAKVYIPRTLRLFTNSDFEIILGGEKISDVVSNLVGKYQDLENYIFTNEGRLKSFVNIYLNEEDIKRLDNLETKVYDDDKILLVPSSTD